MPGVCFDPSIREMIEISLIFVPFALLCLMFKEHRTFHKVCFLISQAFAVKSQGRVTL